MTVLTTAQVFIKGFWSCNLQNRHSDHDLSLVRGQRCARKKKTSPTAISPPELNQKADWFMNSCYFTLYIVLYSLYWQTEDCLRNLLCLPEHHFYILCEHFWLFLPDRKLGGTTCRKRFGVESKSDPCSLFGIWVTYAHMLMWPAAK